MKQTCEEYLEVKVKSVNQQVGKAKSKTKEKQWNKCAEYLWIKIQKLMNTKLENVD